MVMLFEAADIQKPRAFSQSADLKDAIQKPGVVDQPDIFSSRSKPTPTDSRLVTKGDGTMAVNQWQESFCGEEAEFCCSPALA